LKGNSLYLSGLKISVLSEDPMEPDTISFKTTDN